EVHRGFRGGHQAMLGENEDRNHALLVEVRVEFVQLVVEVFFAGHRVEVAVETVNHHDLQPPSTPSTMRPVNSPGESSAGSTCWTAKTPLWICLFKSRPSSLVRASMTSRVSSNAK